MSPKVAPSPESKEVGSIRLAKKDGSFFLLIKPPLSPDEGKKLPLPHSQQPDKRGILKKSDTEAIEFPRQLFGWREDDRDKHFQKYGQIVAEALEERDFNEEMNTLEEHK